MHTTNNNLGEIIKNARLNKQFTQERLAEIIGVGPRHIMAIENEGKSPSYEVLYKLLQVLDISGDFVFHPEAVNRTIEQDQFIREFLSCNNREQKIVMATVRTLLRELHNDNENNP